MQKPLPKPTIESQPYWDGCAEGELRYQYCSNCENAQFPPANRCVSCHGEILAWRVSKRKGRVHSYSVVHRAPTHAFKKDTPYVIALIDLDEGFRIMTNVQDSDSAELRIGSTVRIEFESRENGVHLPQAILTGKITDTK